MTLKINWGKLTRVSFKNRKNMDLHNFLEKAKDPKVDKYRLEKYWHSLNSKRLVMENLDQVEREFIYDIIKEYREKWLSHNYPSTVDLRQAYNKIYNRREELQLEYEDLDDIKKVIYSFKK